MDSAKSSTIPYIRRAASRQIKNGIHPLHNQGMYEKMKNQKKSNLTTALILASVVLMFFIGIVVKQTLFR
jgi:hypothetical protein